MIYRVGIDGRDWVEIEVNGAVQVRASGCLALLKRVKQIRGILKTENDLKNFNFEKNGLASPSMDGHENLLLSEVILRARGEWELPYKEDELCHCRAIPTRIVDQAILCGLLLRQVVLDVGQGVGGGGLGDCGTVLGLLEAQLIQGEEAGGLGR